MSRSLVYHGWRGSYGVAYLPSEAPAGTKRDVAVYRPACTATFRALTPNGISGPQKEERPARVEIENGGTFDFKRGICERVRHGHPEAMPRVAELDAQLAALMAQIKSVESERQDALEQAYLCGAKLRVAEVKPDAEKTGSTLPPDATTPTTPASAIPPESGKAKKPKPGYIDITPPDANGRTPAQYFADKRAGRP